jgi:Flp pilus assembly protein TadB
LIDKKSLPAGHKGYSFHWSDSSAAHSFFILLLLLGLVACLGDWTLSVLHSLFFLLVLGLFLSLVFKLLAPRPASLSAQLPSS